MRSACAVLGEPRAQPLAIAEPLQKLGRLQRQFRDAEPGFGGKARSLCMRGISGTARPRE